MSDTFSIGMVGDVDYEVRRAAFNQDEFDELYQYERPTRPLRTVLKERFDEARKTDLWTVLKAWIPLLDWVFSYKRSYFLGDVIAGVTLAIMNVPQAMAYADLANIPPILGLYTSFVPPLIYAIFGNSRHCCIGMFAVISLMVGTVTMRLAPDDMTNIQLPGNNPNALGDMKSVQVTVAITFTTGVVLAIMAILQLHFVASYMSDELVGGFTTGAAFHVAASQLPKLFGLKIPPHQGLFKLFYILRDVILSLPQTNIPDLITSVICIIFLHVGKWYINPCVRKRIPIPIPFELIAVIVAAAFSYSFNFHQKFRMSIVSTIPTGFPAPRPPNFSLVSQVLIDSIVLSVVIFAMTISMCKLFGQKHGYVPNSSQELRALALLELVGSFFLCHPSCSSLSRSAVISQIGVNTQLGGVITASLMLIVILWAGVLLEPLPKCILSSIIMIALQGMFLQVKKTRELWTMSKIDLAIWLVAFLATVIWDVVEGLAIAVAFALVTVIFRTQWPKSAKLVQIGDTEIYRNINRYGLHTNFSHIVIFRYDAPLLFFNSENFKTRALEEVQKQEDELRRVAAAQVNTVADDENKAKKKRKLGRIYDLPSLHFMRRKDRNDAERMVRYLIIDASGFTHMDQMGVKCFKDLAAEMAKKQVEVLITSCRAKVRQKCLQCGLFESFPRKHFYPSIHDAVLFALRKDQLQQKKELSELESYPQNRRRSRLDSLTLIERNTGRRVSVISRTQAICEPEEDLELVSGSEQTPTQRLSNDLDKRLDDDSNIVSSDETPQPGQITIDIGDELSKDELKDGKNGEKKEKKSN